MNGPRLGAGREGRVGVLRRARRWLSDWAVQPLPAYGSILLLQLKVVWGMWWARDFSTGDTSAYFVLAHRWFAEGTLDFVWLPLYTGIYYGSFLYLTADAYSATLAHRLVLVLGLAPLVLAVMRRLLEPRVAWLVAAWWVVLPVNHDVLYEIHLFGVLPALLATLVIVGPPSRWRRGLAIAVLVVGTVFVRNELIVPAALLAAACLVFEARVARNTAPGPRPRRSGLVLPYGVPMIVVVAVIVAAFHASSAYDLRTMVRGLSGKHGLNVCQIYAVGYQERHPGWTKNPWLECPSLVKAAFGQPTPSLSAAFLANPRAMLRHFRWNIGLIPNALQVMLFNATWGTARPGYEPIVARSTTALVLSVVLGLLYVAGAACLGREWRSRWSAWLRPRAWGWLTLGVASIGCLVVMVTQRPRPAYLYSLELLLQALAGLCIQVLIARGNLRAFAAAFPAAMLMLLALVPSYYARAPHRPIHDAYRVLAPVRSVIAEPGAAIVLPGHTTELCAYLLFRAGPSCRALDYYALRAEVASARGWWSLLDDRGATMFYADETVAGDPAMANVLADAASAAWEVSMRETTPHGERLLLQKRRPAASRDGLAGS